MSIIESKRNAVKYAEERIAVVRELRAVEELQLAQAQERLAETIAAVNATTKKITKWDPAERAALLAATPPEEYAELFIRRKLAEKHKRDHWSKGPTFYYSWTDAGEIARDAARKLVQRETEEA